MSGMRPTGRLHLGHYVGVLAQWVALARDNDTFFEVADLHALTTAYDRTEDLATNIRETARDWLAAGVDPERSTLYVQSHIPQISELHLLLSMIVRCCLLRGYQSRLTGRNALGDKRQVICTAWGTHRLAGSLGVCYKREERRCGLAGK